MEILIDKNNASYIIGTPAGKGLAPFFTVVLTEISICR
jgi:hypothetical protein